MRRALALAGALAASASAAVADGETVVVYQTDEAFEDVAFNVEQAIIGRGLVVDYTSHVGEMLNRTAADVGAETQVFDEANVYLFCSAVLSRKMMEADPTNVAYCPYGVFVATSDADDGPTMVGYRKYPEGAMQEVQTLLDEIAREGAGLF